MRVLEVKFQSHEAGDLRVMTYSKTISIAWISKQRIVGHAKELLIFHCCYKHLSSLANHAFGEIPESNYGRKSANQCSAESSYDGKLAKQRCADEVLVSFRNMNVLGEKPTKFVLCTALNSCAKTSNWHLSLQIHAQVVQRGYVENLIINSALIDVYATCGALEDARRVFNNMKRHDQVSWTSMVAGFSQNGHAREAILLFKKMLSTEIKPNCFTYVSVISTCIGLELAFESGMSLHAHVIKLGYDVNGFIVSSLIDCYSKCGKLELAVSLFNTTSDRDNILLNSMISGFSQNLHGEEALKLFVEMRNGNLAPTDHTLTSILNACGSLTVLRLGRQLHVLLIKMGSYCNMFVVSALIDMYSKCGSIDEARCVFDQAVAKNSILWTSMISGYAQSGRGLDSLELFNYSVKEGFKPDLVCFTAVLTACNHAGLLGRGIEYFNSMRDDYDLVPELDHYACLVDLYARTGNLRKAKELMEEMPCAPNSVMLSSFLSSCKVYGEVELARDAAYKLFKMEPHSAAPYITMASIYGEAGLWSEMVEIRKMMKLKGIKRSAGWSWIEIGKGIHFFCGGDISHSQSQELYLELEKLNLETRGSCYVLEEVKE